MPYQLDRRHSALGSTGKEGNVTNSSTNSTLEGVANVTLPSTSSFASRTLSSSSSIHSSSSSTYSISSSSSFLSSSPSTTLFSQSAPSSESFSRATQSEAFSSSMFTRISASSTSTATVIVASSKTGNSRTTQPFSSTVTTVMQVADPSTTTMMQSPAFKPSATAAVSRSSRGFLRNKAALVGVFTTLGLLSLCMVILFTISWKKRALKRGRAEDSDSIRNLASDSEMAESSPGLAASYSGPTPPEGQAGDFSQAYPLSAHPSLTREPGFDPNHNNGALKDARFLQVPPSLQASFLQNNNSSPMRQGARGSYQPSVDSFYCAA